MMTSKIVELDDDANEVEGGHDDIDVHDDDYKLHTMLLITMMRLILRIVI